MKRVAGKLATAGETTSKSPPQAGPQNSAARHRSTPFAIPPNSAPGSGSSTPACSNFGPGSSILGLALARGNARTDTLTTSFNATRVTRKDKITLTFSQIYGTARVNGVTSTIASAIRGGWSYNRDINPRFFVTTLNEYEHDGFQDLDLRFVAGAGFGVNAVKNPKTNLSFGGGVRLLARELHRSPASQLGGSELRQRLRLQLLSATNVTQSFRVFPNLSNTGEYRMNFDIGAVTALKKWLGWHVTASDRFLSNPVFGRQRNDLILSTGFRVSFAR